MIRKFVKKTLNSFGYDLISYDPNMISDFDRVYERVFSAKDKLVVLDVGSHRGESIARFKRLKREAQILGFEPDKENYSHLIEEFGDDSSVDLFNVGIGSKNGKLPFYRYAKSDVGGFNEINIDDEWTKIRSAQLKTEPKRFLTKSYEVPVIKLDDVLVSSSIDRVNILKIDTQGFEDDVLLGCSDALSSRSVDFIELELIIKGPYSKTLSFSKIEEIMDTYGYKLYGIQRGLNYYYSPILQFDILFTRPELYRHGSINY